MMTESIMKDELKELQCRFDDLLPQLGLNDKITLYRDFVRNAEIFLKAGCSSSLDNEASLVLMKPGKTEASVSPRRKIKKRRKILKKRSDKDSKIRDSVGKPEIQIEEYPEDPLPENQEDISRKTEEEDGTITLEEFATTVLQREDDYIKLNVGKHLESLSETKQSQAINLAIFWKDKLMDRRNRRKSIPNPTSSSEFPTTFFWDTTEIVGKPSKLTNTSKSKVSSFSGLPHKKERTSQISTDRAMHILGVGNLQKLDAKTVVSVIKTVHFNFVHLKAQK
ncbi:uncharacterized protein LOC111708672 [Eurytemora carolleeae]|uniref:uncharacterized protein LOC111708672 n=1 Tax=Eurytemora carolleeae TaxID=1294199 RepID=UPI000C76FAC6|nr:uncharacterized protein LOC111708672 [Eurytemora carolleeae]|eukprot:XP_023337880.1 uncharacterized protein LOC111708672 [Eurytemora affinis]